MIFLPPGVLQQQIPTGPTTLVSDTFTDTNGTLLTSHTPDTDTVGGGWSVPSGSFTIESNEAESGGGAANVALIDAGQAGVSVTVDTTDITEAQGIVARASDVNNFWLFWGDDGKLYDKVAGSFTERASVTKIDSPRTMHMDCDGASITVWFNSETSATYASATFNQTETEHGLRAFGSSRNLDDLTVVTV